jgi:hypothetical protein
MGNNNEIRIVLGSLRYKSANNVDSALKVPFVQTVKEIVEYDKTVNLDLQQLFDDERQKSLLFRPSCKFLYIFKNSYTGFSDYQPYQNSLYFSNAESNAESQCLGEETLWEGFPQYSEFDFVRTDYQTSGYTVTDGVSDPPYHLNFVAKSASSYNWNFYMSYAFENDYDRPMNVLIYDQGLRYNVNWTVSDGIPFVIRQNVNEGKNLVSFICGVKHGMSVGELAKLSFNYTTSLGVTDTFQIYSLGDGKFGSEEYIFNILNPGFVGNAFNQGITGTAKRVVIDSVSNEVISKYYVRKNKIVTNPNDSVVAKSGFERNIFKDEKKIDRAALTPNNVRKFSIKEGSQSYTLSFNVDLDLVNLLDNQKRPVSELFFTTIWHGYFGWFNPLREGWEFNLPLDPLSNNPTIWWGSSDSLTNLSYDSYTKGLNPAGVPYEFFHTIPPISGDVINGDFCEWNDYEQSERVISNMFHKLVFNSNNFTVSLDSANGFSFIPGYYYQPHFPVTIRSFSDYIEQGEEETTTNIPNWAYYSENKKSFVWKDIYEYGYVDSDDIGVNFPFLNGKHHPFKNIVFRLIPEGSNYLQLNNVQDPLIDPCE